MLRVVTPAVVEPVTVEDVKAHLRVTHDEDDALLGAQITSAREAIELETGVALVEAEYLWAPEHPPRCGYVASIPLWPATVGDVTYWDGEARVDADPDVYLLDDFRGRLTLGTYAQPRVAFTTAPDAIPESLKSAIKLRVMAEYEADAEEAEKLRDASLRIARLHRRNFGV